MGYRVVQWGTGNTGRLAFRGIIQHPDLELVGLHVHGADKVGRDAGELAGLPPTGVIATADPALIADLDADCLAYLGDGIGRVDEAIAEMCGFLAAGVNVVTTSLNDLVYPAAAAPSRRDPLATACAAGGRDVLQQRRRSRFRHRPGAPRAAHPDGRDRVDPDPRDRQLLVLRPAGGDARPVRVRTAAGLPGAVVHDRMAHRLVGRRRHPARRPARRDARLDRRDARRGHARPRCGHGGGLHRSGHGGGDPLRGPRDGRRPAGDRGRARHRASTATPRRTGRVATTARTATAS